MQLVKTFPLILGKWIPCIAFTGICIRSVLSFSAGSLMSFIRQPLWNRSFPERTGKPVDLGCLGCRTRSQLNNSRAEYEFSEFQARAGILPLQNTLFQIYTGSCRIQTLVLSLCVSFCICTMEIIKLACNTACS